MVFQETAPTRQVANEAEKMRNMEDHTAQIQEKLGRDRITLRNVHKAMDCQEVRDPRIYRESLELTKHTWMKSIGETHAR